MPGVPVTVRVGFHEIRLLNGRTNYGPGKNEQEKEMCSAFTWSPFIVWTMNVTFSSTDNIAKW